MLDENLKRRNERNKTIATENIKSKISLIDYKIKAIEAFGVLKDSQEWNITMEYFSARLDGFKKELSRISRINVDDISIDRIVKKTAKEIRLNAFIQEDSILLNLAKSKNAAINRAMEEKEKLNNELKKYEKPGQSKTADG